MIRKRKRVIKRRSGFLPKRKLTKRGAKILLKKLMKNPRARELERYYGQSSKIEGMNATLSIRKDGGWNVHNDNFPY